MTASASRSSGRRSVGVPIDPRDPGDAYLQREIDENRTGERMLIPKALLALVVVGVLVAVRQVFFA